MISESVPHAPRPLKVIANEHNGLCIENDGPKRRRFQPLNFGLGCMTSVVCCEECAHVNYFWR